MEEYAVSAYVNSTKDQNPNTNVCTHSPRLSTAKTYEWSSLMSVKQNSIETVIATGFDVVICL